ncbi:hypothetical protein OIO90_002590 [Microbotryomycetes sp. JL221]|nr:hypothetical protein OIO90_002590 [Microbotryomycetes sp. JL221]
MTTISYREPTLPHLLTLISFLYLLQVGRTLADKVLGAGLIGECAIGVVYGPVTDILEIEWQQTFVAMGYIGLVLIVFEGGLTMSPKYFLPSLPLSIMTALIGILLPIAFTFGLFSTSTFNYPQLWSFTTGSALASTSLGTTFFVMKTQSESLAKRNKRLIDLSQTRVGAILQAAALVDDIVALVLLSVIVALGQGETNESGQVSTNNLGWTIGRPIVVSIVLAAGVPVVTLYAIRPTIYKLRLHKFIIKGGQSAQLCTGVFVLASMLAASYYAGTTMLLGAFLAGVMLLILSDNKIDFVPTFEQLIGPLQRFIFVPLFFGSIGITIPFLDLFTGTLIWKGFVYATLMTIAKVSVGLTIILFDTVRWIMLKQRTTTNQTTLDGRNGFDSDETFNGGLEQTMSQNESSSLTIGDKLRFKSLPAAGFLGFAMVARGEIGVLILQVAHNSSGQERILGDEAYLVGLWAVTLCTIVGPVVFAVIVKRFGLSIVDGEIANDDEVKIATGNRK